MGEFLFHYLFQFESLFITFYKRKQLPGMKDTHLIKLFMYLFHFESVNFIFFAIISLLLLCAPNPHVMEQVFSKGP